MLIAATVREETTVRARWLAGKLHMGSVANVSRASREIARRLPGDRNLKRLRRKIYAKISSWDPIPAAMKRSAPIVETFAEIEGLDAHGRSASIRVEG